MKETKSAPVRRKNIDMTEGPIAKQLVLFAIPLLMGDLMQQLYNTVDSMIVGNYVSKAALSAVGDSGYVINVLIGLFTGISLGCTVLISKRYGAKDKEGIKVAVNSIVWMTLIMGAVFTAVGLLFTPFMLHVLNVPVDAYDDASHYLLIYFVGISGQIIYNMLAGMLRAIGDSKRPLYVLVLTSVLNIGLDMYFILQLDMGVSGAALATIVSQFISAIVLWFCVKNTEVFHGITLLAPGIDKKSLKEILVVGLPFGIQKSVISFSNSIVVSYINEFGSGAMAAWSVYLKLDDISLRTMQSMGSASTTFVAQNVGAHKEDRLKRGVRAAFIISFAMCAFYAVFFVSGRYTLIRMFNKDPEVLYYGSLIFCVLMPVHSINNVAQIYAGVLRGMGDSKTPMLIMLSCFVVVRQIYLHIVWSYTQEFIYVILAYPFTWTVCAAAFMLYVRKKGGLNLERAECINQ